MHRASWRRTSPEGRAARALGVSDAGCSRPLPMRPPQGGAGETRATTKQRGDRSEHIRHTSGKLVVQIGERPAMGHEREDPVPEYHGLA